MSFQLFLEQFKYRPDLAGNTGIEQEAFLLDDADRIVPNVRFILPKLDSDACSYELSACQIEYRTGPSNIRDLRRDLTRQADEIHHKLAEYKMSLLYVGAGPASVPLDHHPCPRYDEIVAKMPKEVLRAAVRVAGTHIHVGMPDRHTALKTYNRVIEHTDKLCEMGNLSNGKRIKLFKVIEQNLTPEKQSCWYDYYQTAVKQGFHDDLGKCWWWVRISKFGTIEFRMFDSTESIDQIVEWAEFCHNLCFPT